ncbi:MAG: FadR/GntR family transcriptional regulator [Marinomonas sp.]|jgi:GntR family transcriptional regulator, transcriptional repressor for pyruvate dehydrogenase complex|uniref:FadR/GntR family transcriptional regulator n=1 Tax=Marinomonas TaxID=28253 RepID=UPI0022445099|nr:FadR/GntR family transcriptional regulator [Marinomonas pontica]MCW8355660.1 FadR family transcriptional regulator [Marinomonas pontica]
MSGKAKTKLRLPQQIAIRLRDKIAKEKLVPGDKLPTEPDLIKEMGVSRTVLREAIATLKAEGLVEAKQGVGVFVSSPKTETMASLAQGEVTLTVIIETLEIRIALEVESIALAISRSSIAQEAEIYRCFDLLERQLKNNKSAEQEDYDFHLAIANASNNQHFIDLLSILAKRTIPRTRLHDAANLTQQPGLEEILVEEHKAIIDAYAKKDIEAAKKAMRTHLINGLGRYRGLIREIDRKSS